MFQTVTFVRSDSDQRRLGLLRPALGGLAICLALGLGCGESGGGGGGSGGTPSAGGTTETGGTTASGGTTSSGGSDRSGGTVGSGGASSSGGTTASGGRSSSGGTTASGGSTGSGGRSGSGGGEATGGDDGTGGGTAKGGSTAAGGRTGGGGRSATGGGTAGSTGTGGSTGTEPDGGTESGRSAGCGKAPGIPSSQYNNGSTISITAASKQRRYILNVPTNYDNTKAYKLIIAFHQLNGNDKQMYNEKYYNLLPLSNNSAIFVAPNGQKNGSPCTGTGNGDSGCGWPDSSGQDVALADAVVAQIKENFCIDTNRIFANGWSYGGSMSYKTACQRPLGGTNGYLRAIAVYAGAQLSGNCTPSKPVAYYASHGTRDSVLNYDSMGVPLFQNFAKANGCTYKTPTKVTSGAHVCTTLTGCTDGYPTEFCSFNGDHTPYPDNGQPQGSWQAPLVWEFLNQF